MFILSKQKPLTRKKIHCLQRLKKISFPISFHHELSLFIKGFEYRDTTQNSSDVKYDIP